MTPAITPLISPPPPDEPPALPAPLTTFPDDLPLSLTSSADYDEDLRIDRAVDGTGRARLFYSAPKLRIDAALRGLDRAQWREFDTFYRANRGVPFTIPWGPCGSQADLPVIFATAPKQTFHTPEFSSVAFTLIEFP
jgi:hypothetical protein